MGSYKDRQLLVTYANLNNGCHSTIANALKERRRLIVITADEITRLAHLSQLVHLIKEKLCDLAVKGTIL